MTAQARGSELAGFLDRLFSRKEQVNPLMPQKIDAIDHAFGTLDLKSFADLGGVWGVRAGYTFYTLDKYPIEAASLVDLFFTDEVKRLKKRYPQLELIQGDFGRQAITDKVPPRDAVFLFDVLLHQVGTDWQDVLRMYSALTDCFIVYNPQWTGSETVRLVDLGKEGYFENVPHDSDEEPYASIFKNLDAIDPDTGKPNRDYPGIWQWGIVDDDLTGRLDELGYEVIYYKNHGQWGDLKNFEGHAFVFHRR